MDRFSFIRRSDSVPAGHEHWCANCDGAKVRAGEPDTGSWYFLAGHVWNGIQNGIENAVSDDYHMFVIALCNACDPFPIVNNLVAHSHDLSEAEPRLTAQELLADLRKDV